MVVCKQQQHCKHAGLKTINFITIFSTSLKDARQNSQFY